MTHHRVTFLSACESRHKAGAGGETDNIHITIKVRNKQKRLKALKLFLLLNVSGFIWHLRSQKSTMKRGSDVLIYLRCLILVDTPIMISNCILNVPEIFLDDLPLHTSGDEFLVSNVHLNISSFKLNSHCSLAKP